jgi:hypothetical protein
MHYRVLQLDGLLCMQSSFLQSTLPMKEFRIHRKVDSDNACLSHRIVIPRPLGGAEELLKQLA